MKLIGFGVMVEDTYNDHCLVTFCDDIPPEDMRYNGVCDYSNLMHDTYIVTAFMQQFAIFHEIWPWDLSVH